MKKYLILTVLCVVFGLVVSAGIISLTLPAIDTGTSSENGKWSKVCCGSKCPGGEDFCLGTGSYKCCK